MYGYRFWDDQNKKVIRRKNVSFNENLFYKDKFSIESTCAGKLSNFFEKSTLEEISESDVANRNQSTCIEVELEPGP